jgi:hypothetical protein
VKAAIERRLMRLEAAAIGDRAGESSLKIRIVFVEPDRADEGLSGLTPGRRTIINQPEAPLKRAPLA